MNTRQRLLKRFMNDEQGAIAVMFALMLPVIIAFIGLGLDVSFWYSAKRSLQGAADAAAIAAAYEISAGSSNAIISAAALTDATRNGYDNAIGTITVNRPPVTGANIGNTSAVEVILSEPRSMLFASVIKSTGVTISSRAVALSGGGGDACILGLNTTLQNAIELSGNAAITATGCVIASNSSHASSIEITGNATITADSLSTVGGYSVSGAATLTTTTAPQTNASAISDPYSSFAPPPYAGCDQTAYVNRLSDNTTITPATPTTPYVFCTGLDIKGTLTLNPGVYIIDAGTLNLNATGTLTGTGVTLILTSSSGSDYAKFTMNGSSTINLSAPTSGAYAGMLMYGDRAGPNQVNVINGNTAATFNGALYFPSSNVSFSGNSNAGGSACTQIIADTVRISGATAITTSGCVAAGATLAGTSATQLIE